MRHHPVALKRQRRRDPAAQQSRRLRQVVARHRPPLRPQVEPVVLHLHKQHAVDLLVHALVQKQDAGLDAAVRVEHASGQADHGDQAALYQHLAQGFVGGAALEDDTFGHDDGRAAGGRQVLGHVVDKQHLAAGGLD